MNKERIKTILIVVLLLVILTIGMFYLCNREYTNAYQKGIQDTTSLLINQMINDLNSNGFTTIWINQGNQTIPVKLGVVQ